MSDFLGPLATRIEVGLAVGLLLTLLYFSADIFKYLSRRDFGRMNIYLVYFTRNDNGRGSRDTMNSRLVGSKLSIQDDIYKNRFLFWRMIIVGFRATLDRPVLNFEPHPDRWLMPIRAWFIANRCSAGELKRANGHAFYEHKYYLTVVFDHSDEGKRNRVLKCFIIRSEDLKNFDRYERNPPEAGKNFELMKKIVEAHRTKQGSFVSLQMVTS